MRADSTSEGAAETVCVTGASSQLGVFLLPRLTAAGFRVLAVSRKAPSALETGQGGAAAADVRWLHPDGLLPGPGGADPVGPLDHLVSCGPLPLARDIVLRHGELRRVIAFSSSSVLSKAQSPDARENRLMSTLARQEQDLAGACAQRGLPLLLLRPTLIYGCGRDRNITTLARLGGRFGFIPLASRAAGLRQPVHADDLADLAVRALASTGAITLTAEACGGSTLTYRDMVRKVAAAVPRRVRLVTLPAGLFSALVWLASRLPGLRALSPEMVRRQRRHLVFDDSALREALGWSPRPFQPTAADFEVPEHARALQLPRHEQDL